MYKSQGGTHAQHGRNPYDPAPSPKAMEYTLAREGPLEERWIPCDPAPSPKAMEFYLNGRDLR